MGEKDITEKHLEEYNDVFADIVNVVLFHGRRIIQEEDLFPITAVRSQYRMESSDPAERKVREEERDVGKFWKKGSCIISVIGLENQTDRDDDMPLRVMAYDGASYKSQIAIEYVHKKNSIEKSAQEDVPESDFTLLSYDDSASSKDAGPVTVKEDDEKIGTHRYPVLSIVLYYGAKRWTGPRSIYQAIDIPEILRPFVSDYKMNLVEVAWLDRAAVDSFQSDFRIVADYFVQKRTRKEYKPSAKQIRHVDATLKLLAALSNDRRFAEEFFITTDQKKEASMERFIDQAIEKGRIKGHEEGCAEATQNDIVRMTEYFLKEDPNLSREDAVAKATSILQPAT